MGTYGFILFQGLPSIDQLENPETAIASEVRSRDGVVINISLKIEPGCDTKTFPYATQALTFTEDHRFYNHWGMDMFRT